MLSKHIACLIILLFMADCVGATNSPVKDYRKGFALFRSGKHKEAVSKWKRALRGRKELSRRQQLKLFLGLSSAYEQMGDKERARKTIGWAEKIAPNNKAVKKSKARLNKKALTMSEAFETLDNALLIERASPGSGKDSFEEAAAAFKSAIEKKVNLSRAHYGLGTCLFYTAAEKKEAEHHLLESHRLAPHDSETNWQLAVFYKGSDDLTKELVHLNACLSSGASNPQLEVAASSAFARKNSKEDTPKALDHAAKAIAFDPSYGEAIVAEITNEPLKAKIMAMVKKAKAEARERDKKEEKVLIVKYFGSPT